MLRGILTTLISVSLIIGIGLFTTTVVHQVSLKREAPKVLDYGRKLALFDGEINVIDEGQGRETILLLPGQGTASPYLDFKPLINQLKKDYRVVTMEPFGYGLSSQTKRQRSVSNYVEEIQAVVRQLNLKHYKLMGHSIAGLYAINYAQIYPKEMTGFIGIDSSTPEQPWPGIDMGVFDFLKEAGVFRAFIKMNPETAIGVEKSDPNFEQTRLLTMKNMSSRNMAEELQELSHSFPDSRGLRYPKDMPVLLFVADNDNSMPHWLEMHQDQLKGLKKGKLVQLKGAHYLHHTQTPTISKEIKKFLD
ncbi:alpha/beta fold hydrolase [Vagococcus intermedius]|uniref:Alpha/beta hydrolase n=1 Tax=Vagococcus intermedius TaxID=2991418 RepID=A0AAF0CUE5_9ENTE|nr:alpha/beta hydrolase [Vagococcus intermedius]WEG73062.1 alpha/beta hydrolase [Vagococcus intermedius]WEG75146.1 alpha/beta hydrolase [Vagococcus intermedius]